jgi:hypothetical protein
MASVQNALNYLEKHNGIVCGDYRCQYFKFKLWWLLNSGSILFAEERLTIPFDRDTWEFADSSVSTLLSFFELASNLNLKFIHAIAQFHLGNYDFSREAFRALEVEAQEMGGGRRIFKSYMASTSKGEPISFSGHVEKVFTERHRGSVWVEKTRQSMPFYFRDFTVGSLSVGDPLPEFYISFNFIGAIADPVSFYRRLRETHD